MRIGKSNIIAEKLKEHAHAHFCASWEGRFRQANKEYNIYTKMIKSLEKQELLLLETLDFMFNSKDYYMCFLGMVITLSLGINEFLPTAILEMKYILTNYENCYDENKQRLHLDTKYIKQNIDEKGENKLYRNQTKVGRYTAGWYSIGK